jgi:outer membrane protein
VLGGLLLSLFTPAMRAESSWSVRLRATYLETIDKSAPFSALGINFAADSVVVSDKLIPEIDIDYAFSETLSAELVLTIPQKHSVDLTGAGRLGSFKHLPPTLLLQYHPMVSGNFQPYFGVGVNFTLIFDDDLSVAGVPLKLDSYSVGLAAQAGFDYRLDEKWSLNFDVKRAALRTAVKAGGAKLTEAKLDPWLYAVGFRYDF